MINKETKMNNKEIVNKVVSIMEQSMVAAPFDSPNAPPAPPSKKKNSTAEKDDLNVLRDVVSSEEYKNADQKERSRLIDRGLNRTAEKEEEELRVVRDVFNSKEYKNADDTERSRLLDRGLELGMPEINPPAPPNSPPPPGYDADLEAQERGAKRIKFNTVMRDSDRQFREIERQATEKSNRNIQADLEDRRDNNERRNKVMDRPGRRDPSYGKFRDELRDKERRDKVMNRPGRRDPSYGKFRDERKERQIDQEYIKKAQDALDRAENIKNETDRIGNNNKLDYDRKFGPNVSNIDRARNKRDIISRPNTNRPGTVPHETADKLKDSLPDLDKEIRDRNRLQSAGLDGNRADFDDPLVQLDAHSVHAGRERRNDKKDVGLRPSSDDYRLPGGGYDYAAMRDDMEQRGEIPRSRRGDKRGRSVRGAGSRNPPPRDTGKPNPFDGMTNRQDRLDKAKAIMDKITGKGPKPGTPGGQAGPPSPPSPTP